MVWMAMALGAAPKGNCMHRDDRVDFVAVELSKSTRGSQGIVHSKALRAVLPSNTTAELRYEHAFGATFVILELRRGSEVLVETSTWHDGVQLTLGSERPPGFNLGSLSMKTSIEGKPWTCVIFEP